MKILYITGQLKYQGGIERVLCLKANYFADVLDQNVFLLTYEQGKNPFIYSLSKKIIHEDLGLNYDVAIHQKGLFTPRNLLKGIRHFFLLKKKLKEINPDVIIIPNGGFDFMFLPYLAHDKFLVREMHSSLYARSFRNVSIKEKIRFLIDTFFEKKYTSVVVLNNTEKNFIFNDNVKVIPNPINVGKYNRPNLDSKRVIAAGRISPVKGFDNLIRTWSSIIEKDPDITLHIYGDGDCEYRSYLNDLIKSLHLERHVFLEGAVSSLLQVLPSYSLFVCSSHTECFPMVFLEAMSCGVPVISFDCPSGPKHIITDGVDGFLVKDQSLDDLVSKVLQYYSWPLDVINKYSKASFSSVEKYNIDTVMKEWMTFFKQNTK